MPTWRKGQGLTKRAKTCGYSGRFPQTTLVHNSQAAHEAYADPSVLVCPPLDECEQAQEKEVILLPFALAPG